MADLIVIDAGHGGRDPGAVNGKRRECDDNLRFSKALAVELQRRGVRTLLTRGSDIFLSLDERVRICNNAKPKYFVSIHRNAFSDIVANGSEAWIYYQPAPGQEALGRKLAQAMASCGFKDRGVKKTNSFTVVCNTYPPAFLLELGFLTNNRDNLLFDSQFSALITKIADCLAPNSAPQSKKCGACGQTIKV